MLAVRPESVIDPSASAYDRYFQTAYERQRVYHRRFIQKLPAPWTTDSVMDKYAFTNVFRDLDRGTIHYRERLLEPMLGSGATDGDILASTAVYRLFNRTETWDVSLGPPILSGRYDAREVEERLRAQKGPVFTSAHMVCAYASHPGVDKIDRVCRFVKTIFENRTMFANIVKAQHHPALAWERIKDMPGIGPFLGYEVYSDLLYAGSRFFPWDEDAWANVGPGAHRGLKVIFPNHPPSAHLDLMRKLQDEQETAFERLGLDFYALTGGKRMTLRSIEHWCCEFFKFNRGSCKTTFTPRTLIV